MRWSRISVVRWVIGFLFGLSLTACGVQGMPGKAVPPHPRNPLHPNRSPVPVTIRTANPHNSFAGAAAVVSPMPGKLVAVGGNRIGISVNDGRNWSYRVLGRNVRLPCAVFPNAEDGMIVGETTSPTQSNGLLLTTRDGGARWSRRTYAYGPPNGIWPI